MIPRLFFCAEGNPRYAQIAIEAGLGYGARLPGTIYYSPEFVDQDWRSPNRSLYMQCLKQHHPRIATVLDLEKEEQLQEVLEWAEEAAALVQEAVVIIPKISGVIERIPHQIGGKEIRLGYSVPTKYAGTELGMWEFAERPVHLLGGGITAQLKLRRYLNVQSADGNMATKAAKHWTFFDGARWVSIEKLVGNKIDMEDGMYTAFYLSCIGMLKAWEKGTLWHGLL